MWSPIALSKNPNRIRAGLTLVELVLAFGMFSFLMASVGYLVLTSLRVQRSWGQLVVPAQSAERALVRLAQDLQVAQPLFAIPFQVTGGGQGIELARLGTATDADGQPVTEWLRVAYRIDRVGEDVALVRDEWVWREDEAGGDPRRHEMLTRLTSGRFTIGMLNEENILGWPSSWDGEADGIPQLVRFEAALPATGAGQPMTLDRVIRNPAGKLPEVEQP